MYTARLFYQTNKESTYTQFLFNRGTIVNALKRVYFIESFQIIYKHGRRIENEGYTVRQQNDRCIWLFTESNAN